MSDDSSSSCQQQEQPEKDENQSKDEPQQTAVPQTQNQSQHQQQELSKWACEYCTYENFPLSLKCTMCKGQKPLLNEDIFRLSPTQQLSTTKRSTSNLASGSSVISPTRDGDNIQKWFCSTCTYFNLSHARRCLQCNSKREDEILIKQLKPSSEKSAPSKVISEYDSLSDQLNALNVCRSTGEDELLELFHPGSDKARKRRNNSPISKSSASAERPLEGLKESDSNSGAAKHQSPTSISPVSTCPRGSSTVGKWSCAVCFSWV